MGRVYDIFDKFSIISIAIGLILGIVLAVHHNDSSLWIRSHSACFSYLDG